MKSLILTFGSCYFPPYAPIFGKIILKSLFSFLTISLFLTSQIVCLEWTGTGLVIKGYYFSRSGKLKRWPKMQHSVSALLRDWDIASKLGEAEFVITWSFISFCKNRQYLWRVHHKFLSLTLDFDLRTVRSMPCTIGCFVTNMMNSIYI